jgi:hypothetical protein
MRSCFVSQSKCRQPCNFLLAKNAHGLGDKFIISSYSNQLGAQLHTPTIEMAAMFRPVHPEEAAQEGAKGRADGNERQQDTDANSSLPNNPTTVFMARPPLSRPGKHTVIDQ